MVMTSEEFIFEYLKADQDTGAGAYEKMLSAINTFNWEEVKNYILNLKYYYFLRTSYWLIISQEIKRRANWRCSCGCRENLQVHHTEEGNVYHGEEHLLKGLVCLCKKCHRELHGVFIKVADKKRRRDNKKKDILSQIPFGPIRISESNITGSSFGLTRKMLEEMEREGRIWIDRPIYDEWQIHRI
jgi:hypothetical protein